MVAISTIIPTRDRAALLMGRAIPSVLLQTMDDWECIVVGDGTDHATAEAMADLCARDRRFRFLDLPPAQYPADPWQRWALGGIDAVNAGLDIAQGRWVSYLADDDEYLPHHHEALLAEGERTGADLVYGQGVEVQPNGAIGAHRYGERWPPEVYDITQGSYLLRASLGFRHRRDCVVRGFTWDADMWDRLIAEGVGIAQLRWSVVHRYHPAPENRNLQPPSTWALVTGVPWAHEVADFVPPPLWFACRCTASTQCHDHERVYGWLRQRKPGLIVTVGWRHLVPPDILAAPLGVVGFHSAKLPEYPGRAPVPWAILRGDRETENTMLFLAEEPDAGDIIDRRTIRIERATTATDVCRLMAMTAGEMLQQHLPALLLGRASRVPQDRSRRGPLTTADGWRLLPEERR